MRRGTVQQTHADRVLAFLRQAARPLSAYQILEGLRPDGVAAPVTVYRALDRLRAAGRVHRIESLNAWTPCCDPDHAETPVFAICEVCGAVSEHLDARLARDVADLARRTGFAPARSVIEIRGRCGACRAVEPVA
ncbi:MAG: transcriptional repressor [Rhodobacteraceae bacterium]|nr:MAG: transcriptional repressor [Paracoccaceae bacterium]